MRLIWFGAAWLAGIAIGHFAGLETWPWLLMAAVCFLAIVLLRRHAPYPFCFALLLSAALGAARLQSALPDLGRQAIASHNDTGRKVSLQGIVVEYPDVRDRYIGLRVRADTVSQFGTGETEPTEGLVLVIAPRYGDFAYGDRIQAIGVLETPPEDEDFSYRAYLARQGIRSMMPRAGVKRLAEGQANLILGWIYGYRSHALETIYALFPDPEASLLAGILLGLESGIPEEVLEQFNATGTSHVIAISGFNITILSALFFTQFRRWLGARWGTIAAACAIGLYTVFVGADAAVVRAAIMGGLVLVATRLGRQSDALTSLMVAAVLMTAVSPLVLWDVGFQLSFMATLGLVLYAPGLQTWF